MSAGDEQTSRPRKVSIRRYDSSAEADRHDLEYWLGMPEAERVLEVWRLSQEQWQLASRSLDEPGLSRSVARVHRR
jgi:hypothetical protein